jgi:hypothetical protein
VTARWRWGLLVLLLLPFAVVGVGARVAAPSLGDAIARGLRSATRPLERRPRPGKDQHVVATTRDVVLDAGPPADGTKLSIVDRALLPPTPSSTAERPHVAPPSGPVHISADAVQRAIDDDGHTIRARTTLGPDGKPAGARLTGVSGGGLGLVDGDVIVAVDGARTMTDDDATDAALRAVARGDSRLRAILTRDGQPFDVVLDLPLAPGPADAGNRPARP